MPTQPPATPRNPPQPRYRVAALLAVVAASIAAFSSSRPQQAPADPIPDPPTLLASLPPPTVTRAASPAPPPWPTVLLPDGRTALHVIRGACCGDGDHDEPDVPWMLLQAGTCSPPFPNNLVATPCGVAAPAQGGIYTGTTMLTAPYGIPSLPVPVPNPNNPASDPHPNVTRHWKDMINNPRTFEILLAEPLSNAVFLPSPAPPQPLDTYIWSAFDADVRAAFAKYTGITSAAIAVNLVTIVDSARYATYDPSPTPQPAIPPFGGSGVLVWDNRPNVDGTGLNGPTGNLVNEVIILRSRRLQGQGTGAGPGGLCSMLVDTATGQIIEADVIFDGQFFFSGYPGSVASLPSESTLFSHEIGHALGLDHTNLHRGAPNLFAQSANPNLIHPTPAMGFGPSHLQWPGNYDGTSLPAMVGGVVKFLPATNHLASPAHPDEVAGLSRIYPVQAPALGRAPLINSTATVRGYVRMSDGSTGDPLRNVVPLLRAATAAFTYPRTPAVGTMSGLVRLSGADIVGMADTVAGAKGSGAFEIIGIPVPAGPPIVQADIVVEDTGHIGFVIGSGVLAEWFSEAFLNGSGINVPSLGPQYVFQSLATLPFVPSMGLVQGTVIDVSIVDPGTPGGLGNAIVEAASRPVVQIEPRARPSAGGTVTITIWHNYPLVNDILLVNGVPFPDYSYTSGPTDLNQYQREYTLSESSLPPTPARLRFSSRETGVPGGLNAALGVNEVVY